ncbi:MAG TPA: serine/threonine-protein kinase [Ktedonobacteraceae bacterium]|nr:serine/threonine-protein kinase [Ktedonobacteraceae bacterium]
MASNIGDLTGKTLGTCTLEKLIGQGGMGAVYFARQTRPSRNVAIKVLQPNLAINSEVYQEFLARFRREADVIARLEHINIMPIYEYGEEDGLAYLVMPYLTGGSLRDLLARRGALPLREAATYLDQAAAALDYAHAQGIIHRDLKPANFLLHADGRLVLADFGIARMMQTDTAGSTLTTAGTLLGTPEYMAPEMALGESVDYRADIYELGVVLFQMLSGHVPFTGNTPYAVAVRHAHEPLPLLHQTIPSLPDTVDAVIQKATAKRREDRFQSAGALAQALRQAEAQTDIPTFISTSQAETLAPADLPYQTPQARQQEFRHIAPASPPAIAPANPPGASTPAPRMGYTPAPPAYQTYSTPPPAQPPGRRQPWMLLIGVLLAALLVIGGVLVGLQLNRAGTHNPAPGPTAASTPHTTAIVRTTPTAGATATPAQQATPTPTSTAASTPSATVPTGQLLYSATSPGPGCDTGGGKWAVYNGASINCLGGATRISNTSQKAQLQGIILTALPGQSFPANYVVQVQLQQSAQAANDIGVYFRNQPGAQQGVYSFMIHPNGTWSTYVYNNQTGAPTQLATGNFGDAHTPVTVTIVVNGQQFSFYKNGQGIGSVSDPTYSSGTVGIAVDQAGSVTASNFALYSLAS